MSSIIYNSSEQLAIDFPEFTKLQIHGSYNYPLFSVQWVQTALGVKLTDSVELADRVNIDTSLDTPMIPREDVYLISYYTRPEKGKRFRDYVKAAVRELFVQEKGVLDGILEKVRKLEDELAASKTLTMRYKFMCDHIHEHHTGANKQDAKFTVLYIYPVDGGFEVHTKKNGDLAPVDTRYIHHNAIEKLEQAFHAMNFATASNGQTHTMRFHGTLEGLHDLINGLF